jgi:hypothetical protein
MRNENTFGLHFTLKLNREVRGKFPVYARITVNKNPHGTSLKMSCAEGRLEYR